MSQLKGLFTIACAVGGLLWLCYSMGPDIVRDMRLRHADFVPATDLRISHAECRTHWFLVSFCDVDYSAQSVEPNAAKASLSYVFLGPRLEKTVRLLRHVKDRNVIAADVGLAHVANRVTCLLVFAFSFVGIGVFAMRKMATEEA
jgi:hypothetical protein